MFYRIEDDHHEREFDNYNTIIRACEDLSEIRADAYARAQDRADFYLKEINKIEALIGSCRDDDYLEELKEWRDWDKVMLRECQKLCDDLYNDDEEEI